jgi:hypothetical protein
MILRLVGSPDAVERASSIFNLCKMANDLTAGLISTGKLDKDRRELLDSVGVDIQASFIKVAGKDLGLARGETELPYISLRMRHTA